MYYLHDTETGQRKSLETKNKARATELLVAHNGRLRPAFNPEKARVYMAASDPEVATRTWRIALAMPVAANRGGSANRDRWETFKKTKP